VCPLFTASATDRELNAVDSENAKNLQNDSWRLYQLTKSLSKKDHPFNSFGTGNLQTLKINPGKLKIDTREALLAFHKKYYSANIMKLAVLGTLSLSFSFSLYNRTQPHNQRIYRYGRFGYDAKMG